MTIKKQRRCWQCAGILNPDKRRLYGVVYVCGEACARRPFDYQEELIKLCCVGCGEFFLPSPDTWQNWQHGRQVVCRRRCLHAAPEHDSQQWIKRLRGGRWHLYGECQGCQQWVRLKTMPELAQCYHGRCLPAPVLPTIIPMDSRTYVPLYYAKRDPIVAINRYGK